MEYSYYHVNKELRKEVKNKIVRFGYSKEDAIKFLMEKGIGGITAKLTVDSIYKISANVIKVAMLEPFDNLDYVDKNSMKSCIKQAKLEDVREIKKRRIIELMRRGKSPEEIESIMSKEILENGMRMTVSLAGVKDVIDQEKGIHKPTKRKRPAKGKTADKKEKNVEKVKAENVENKGKRGRKKKQNPISQEDKIEWAKRKKKLAEKYKETVNNVRTYNEEKKKNSKIEELKSKIEYLKVRNFLQKIDRDSGNEIDLNFLEILESLNEVKNHYDLNEGILSKEERGFITAKAKQIIESMRYILSSTDDLEYLMALRGIANLSSFKICQADSYFNVSFTNLGIERKISDIQMKMLIKSNQDYPKDLMAMAFALVRNKITEEDARKVLKGRNVQLETFLMERLYREISSLDVVEFTEKLGKVLENREDAFNAVSRICLNYSNDKAITLSDSFEEEFGEKAKSIKRKAEENKKYSEISWQITKALNDNTGKVQDSILDLIDKKIAQYGLDKSRIIVGKDLEGNNISLRDALEIDEIERSRAD